LLDKDWFLSLGQPFAMSEDEADRPVRLSPNTAAEGR